MRIARASSARSAVRKRATSAAGSGAAAVVGDDARGGLGAVAKHVDGRGRRRDARGRDVGAGERVDERRLAGVELAHHGDQQRPVERLGGVTGGGGQADERGVVVNRSYVQVSRPASWPAGGGGGGAAHQEVARGGGGREAAEPQDAARPRGPRRTRRVLAQGRVVIGPPLPDPLPRGQGGIVPGRGSSPRRAPARAARSSAPRASVDARRRAAAARRGGLRRRRCAGRRSSARRRRSCRAARPAPSTSSGASATHASASAIASSVRPDAGEPPRQRRAQRSIAGQARQTLAQQRLGPLVIDGRRRGLDEHVASARVGAARRASAIRSPRARRAGAGRAPAGADAEPGSRACTRASTPRWGGCTRVRAVDGGVAFVPQGAGAGRRPAGDRPRRRARLRAHAGRGRRARGDRVADARGARRGRADVHVFIEAAAATSDDALAGELLPEGLARACPAIGRCAPRWRGGSPASGAATRRSRSPRRAWPRRPTTSAALARAARQLRRRRRAGATACASPPTRRAPGNPPPLDDARGAGARRRRSRRAGGAGRGAGLSRAPIAAPSGERVRESVRRRARLRGARAFAAGRRRRRVLRLGRIAPDAAARAFVARGAGAQPPPAGQLAGLLTWTHDLFTTTPPLVGLAAAAGHAAEALDRPLLVAVMGEFTRGKSSFVNALAGEEVAPTGVTPTTATINVLRYGPTPAARVVAHDGSTRELPAADVARFLTALRDDEARATCVWSRSSCPSRRSAASRSSTRPGSTRSGPSTSASRATSCRRPTPSSGCSASARRPRRPRRRR